MSPHDDDDDDDGDDNDEVENERAIFIVTIMKRCCSLSLSLSFKCMRAILCLVKRRKAKVSPNDILSVMCVCGYSFQVSTRRGDSDSLNSWTLTSIGR